MLEFREHPDYPEAAKALATSWTRYLAQAMRGAPPVLAGSLAARVTRRDTRTVGRRPCSPTQGAFKLRRLRITMVKCLSPCKS